MTILVPGWMWPISAWALDHIVGQQCEKLMDGFIPMISPSDHVKAVPSGYLTVCHGKSPFLIGKHR